LLKPRDESLFFQQTMKKPKQNSSQNCAVCLAQDMQISINIKPQRRIQDRNLEFKPYDVMA